MLSLTALVALMACVSQVSAAAQPVPDLTFGFDNLWPVLAGTVVTVVVVVYAPFANWFIPTFTPMSADQSLFLHAQMKERLGGLFTFLHPVIPFIYTWLLQAASVAIFSGYLLKRFYDSSNATVAIPDGTWATVIGILSLIFFFARKIVGEVQNQLQWFLPAFILQIVVFLHPIAILVFLIWEINILPDAIVIDWEISMIVIFGLWIIHTFLGILYNWSAYSIMSSPTTTTTARKFA